MDFFQQLTQQLRHIWDGMSGPRRALAIAAALGTVLACAGVGWWATRTDYQVLFAGLAVEDAGAITGRLQAKGVPYNLTAGGTTILVPADRVQHLRVELAVDGLPAKGGKGFGWFDQSSFGMTPFTQHVTFVRALQEELAKTIMQIDPVVHARVHISRPEPSPFVREQKPTTASVVLKLRPGAMLNRNISTGIIALVARSVEGLARENVTLVDANGHVLSEERGPEAGAASAQMEYRRELEQYLASKAEGMLAQVLGPGRAIVRVTAELNHRTQRQRRETYEPEGRVATTEKIVTTKATTNGSSKGSSPGAAGNLPRGPVTGSGPASSSNNVEESVQTDFAVSKVVQELEDKAGSIERLTIAAVVDLNPANGKGKAEAALTLADAQDIIKKAVGFKTDRDEIKVSQARLADTTTEPPAETTPPEAGWDRALPWVGSISLAATALVVVILGAMVAYRWLTARKQVAADAAAAAVVPPTEDVISLQRLAEVLQSNPEALAKVLENWLDQPGTSPPTAAA